MAHILTAEAAQRERIAESAPTADLDSLKALVAELGELHQAAASLRRLAEIPEAEEAAAVPEAESPPAVAEPPPAEEPPPAQPDPAPVAEPEPEPIIGIRPAVVLPPKREVPPLSDRDANLMLNEAKRQVGIFVKLIRTADIDSPEEAEAFAAAHAIRAIEARLNRHDRAEMVRPQVAAIGEAYRKRR